MSLLITYLTNKRSRDFYSQFQIVFTEDAKKIRIDSQCLLVKKNFGIRTALFRESDIQ